ncbi:MAG TPA: xanthine dehydrogenase family protein molybdopterin-binding subunit [Streptosporangiaceae bacterium]|nr:xanthine dehydrogenase family protein molybdopterin-binding subunit [Streptosporangiaceae bacterium]
MTTILGRRVPRVEDRRLLTEGGTYVDDLELPVLARAAQVTFVRSPVAHATLTGIDASAALAEPGVVAVLTGQDFDGPAPDEEMPEPVLATGRVRYVGEPVALILTDGRYQGEDAAELVCVDYDPLPAVVGVDGALDAPSLLFPETGSNVASAGGDQPRPDDELFAGCEVVAAGRLVNQRLAPVPLEVRSAAATWGDGRLTVWASTQNAQITRDMIAERLGLDQAVIRVIVPDVGGGFGAKIGTDRDTIAVAWAARHTGRPVRWTETRSESMVAMIHGRGQRQDVKIGGTRDGRILAYRLDLVQDCGAYPRGAYLASLTRRMAGGSYGIPRVECGYQAVVTNATPVDAYRGAGRPEATAAIERAVDLFAAEAGLDPAEVRRRNLLSPDQFPYTSPTGANYDSGDYAAALQKVLAAAGYEGLRAEQAQRRERGDPVALGIGLSCYVEITAIDWRNGETGRVEVHEDGTATVFTGSSPQGQGHATSWAMLVQEELGIPMADVTVISGDTDLIPVGTGTYGSRSLQLGGAAVQQAAAEVRERGRGLAADLAGASEDDLDLDTTRGLWRVRGQAGTEIEWGKVAAHGGGLAADVHFIPKQSTFPFGAHLAVVEVDTETGLARLVRHVSADDAGRLVNPLIAEGQRHGGIAQGVAQALTEEVVYDADGNPLTATLADYATITAAELPAFELVASETPTDINPLGAKGIGEAGAIGAPPAVQNAVIDAVAHLGVRHIDMPATPQRVWAAISAAEAAT